MLRIKYFTEFENGFPFLVILGDQASYARARDFLLGQSYAFLNDNHITNFSEILPLEREMLRLNEEECHDIAEQFNILATSNQAGHVYFDTEALGDKIEIMISYNEYDDLF